MVIREVFEILFYFSTELAAMPEYHASYFDKDHPDPTLYPITINPDIPAPRPNRSNPHTPPHTPTTTLTTTSNTATMNGLEAVLGKDAAAAVKYSRAFEALWTRTAPHEPFLILDDTVQLKLREYLEKFPIECYSPPDTALIVVDNKKYKAREILGYFRRGVQLVDYPKETGRMTIDTVSTIKNFTPTGAVRKIPPGKISKLVHPDLHLENYTNAILQVGLVGSEQAHAAERTKIRKRRLKIPPHDNSGYKSESKTKKESPPILHSHSTTKETLEDPSTIKLEGIASFCGAFDKKIPGHLNFPYDESAAAAAAAMMTSSRSMTDLNMNISSQGISPHGGGGGTNHLTALEEAYLEDKNVKEAGAGVLSNSSGVHGAGGQPGVGTNMAASATGGGQAGSGANTPFETDMNKLKTDGDGSLSSFDFPLPGKCFMSSFLSLKYFELRDL